MSRRDGAQSGGHAVLGDDGIDDIDDGVLIIGGSQLQGAEAFEQVQGRDGLIVGLPSGDEIIDGDGEEIGQLGQLLQGRRMHAGFVLGQMRMADIDLNGEFLHGPSPSFAQGLDAATDGGAEFGIESECRHEGEHRPVSGERVDIVS